MCDPGQEAYTELHSEDSNKSDTLSRDVPKVASFRLTAADILEASGPPFAYLRFRSCSNIWWLAMQKLYSQRGVCKLKG